MLIRYDDIKEVTVPHLNGGEGSVTAKMFSKSDGSAKYMISTLPKGSSIGSHEHRSSSEINFVLSGEGLSICDRKKEPLSPGCMALCPYGSTHSIENTGDEDLVLFTVVTELK